MEQKLRALMIGAHPDVCDVIYGGFALKLLKSGYDVKFVSLTNGCCGHYEMQPKDLAARRYLEAQSVAEKFGLTYEIWDVNDCELIATLENRKRMIRLIREYKPDVMVIHRLNDYHADHRNASQLVQDASFLLTVPHFVPEAPAMFAPPVILYGYDGFQNPPFKADLVFDIDDVMDDKYLMCNCHESQFYEWLPFTLGRLHEVPSDPQERLKWFHGTPIDRTKAPNDAELLVRADCGFRHEEREVIVAAVLRDKLVERYGEKGKMVHFAEAYAVSEYGQPLTKELEAKLFPF